MTDVIFRKFNNGEVVAIFPAVPWTSRHGECCASYLHVGQHGAISTAYSGYTKPATPAEYAALLAELKDIYADEGLRIVSRMTPTHNKARREACHS